MALLGYLHEHFLTLQQLLNQAKVSKNAFRALQSQNMMPKAAYVVDLDVRCDSFFGLHEQKERLEFYAKGYVAWLGTLGSHQSEASTYAEFLQRYTATLSRLKSLGFHCQDPKLNDQLNAHIEQEWQHFLNGTYGLCTQSGLPEDIAAKEFAVVIINELTSAAHLNHEDTDRLTRAVNLLDEVSAGFAPHERPASSRRRLIDEVRRQYRLPLRQEA